MYDQTTAHLHAANRSTRPSAFVHLGLFISPRMKRFCFLGEEVQLCRKEFFLLSHMLQQPQLVYSKEQLLDAIESNAFDTVIRKMVCIIRSKLAIVNPNGEQAIVSIYGVGYRLWNRSDLQEIVEET